MSPASRARALRSAGPARHGLAAARAAALAALLLLVGAAAPSHAQPAPGDDAGALDLQSDEAPAEKRGETASQPTRLFVEGAVGHADRRYGLGSRTVGRASVDLRTGWLFGDGLRGVFSGRIDATDPDDVRLESPIVSLREAYVGWQDAAATHVVDFGRINLRQGSGYGYNPTDFFRDNALRTLTTADPFQLRENRLGSVMLRGQRLWTGGSLEAVYSPQLADRRSSDGVAVDLGSTNLRDRGMLVLNTRWSETVNSQLSVYKEAGSSARVGISGTALLSQSVVAHAEVSSSRESTLLSRALGQPDARRTEQRAVAGLSYTTPFQLSLTAEYQYNGFGLDRDGYHALRQAGPQAWAPYYLYALDQQDNAGRDAVLVYASQRDLGLKNLDLTFIWRLNRSDRSRLSWIDLKYRMDKLDLALQFQHNGGTLGAEFGSAINRRLVNLVATVYW